MKTQIKITIENKDKIQIELDRAQGKSEARTLDRFDVAKIAMDAESKLSQLGLSKKDMVGATLYHTTHCRMPGGYKYRESSTEITLVRRSSDWFLAEVKRVERWPNEKNNTAFILTTDQKAKIVSKFLDDNQVK
jgi:hypothetical protein